MKGKNKYLKLKGENVKNTFLGTKMTLYAGLSPIIKYLRTDKLSSRLNELFPTRKYNATKFSFAQLMIAVVFASLCGIPILSRIASLLGLKTGLIKML